MKNFFKHFLFHKVTLVVTGIVALGLIGVSILTKAMPAPDALVTGLSTKNLTTITVTFDHPMKEVKFDGLYLLSSDGETYPVTNGSILADGSIQFDSTQLLQKDMNYTFVAKVGTLNYGYSNLNEVTYGFIATIEAPIETCTITTKLTSLSRIYPTPIGTIIYDGASKLTSDNDNLVYSLDQKTWQPTLDLTTAQTITTLYVMDAKTNTQMSFTNFNYDAKNLAVTFDTTAPKIIDVTLSLSSPSYTFGEKAVMTYDGAAAIKGEGIEFSVDGTTRTTEYKADIYPEKLSVRATANKNIRQLTNILVTPKLGTLEFSLENPICVIDLDQDNDGVEDASDMCSETKGSDTMTSLNPKNFMVKEGIWITNAGSTNKPLLQPANFTMEYSLGCSCEQILAQSPGTNAGELKYGCSKGTIDNFKNAKGRAK